MNFDVYEINQIFYDQIQSISNPHKYGFGFWESGAGSDKFFGIYLDPRDMNIYNWIHSPPYPFTKFYQKNRHSYFYKIDRNHFLYIRGIIYYLYIHGQEAKISLRELVLFMMYMKYLSNI